MKSASIADRSIQQLVTFEDNYAVFAPEGAMELQQGIAFVTETIGYCRENDIRGLIVDVRGVVGLKNPSVAEKFWYTQDWAKASERKVAIALVANRDLIDPTKIGVTMAENVGLRSHVFDNMEDAVEWLKRYL
ncbi:MAG: hypothetical protein HOP17_08095 [Acidobacteria bacterium]|nr:hypothetical protein [Acidobacteriota bacterium]